ncbi:transglycosylase domain-containing protein [Chryseosolibacter indicus]|uniref:Transglycosylase domain-containing protein n=1 Tax=Chryseosolibacter indicus TaxID=2782351 RepID=A0ABS5VJV9_9BACT|nr:transglycosylase domain-containing protein [Chryseosolibacter indicus]MBT1701724.1 transglycosylase domain-containing protein [Chryseosolibacter indicus]
MQKSVEKILSTIRQFADQVYERAKPLLNPIARKANSFIEYYENHPKARLWTLLVVLPLITFFILIFIVLKDTPGKKELRTIKNPLASEVYTADSVLIGRYFIQDRTQVKYEDISPLVIDALIATEDVRFFQHHGIDYVSLGRVLVKSILLQDESAGGGSTITQQLAKNLYPRKEYLFLSMLINKLREAVIARRLESIYSKKDIITLYLNTIPFGDNTFGIQAASKRFFSTDAKKLSLDQAAVLIGMLKATHYYNPRIFPKNALSRRNVVLAQMSKYRKLPTEKADSLKRLPLGTKYSQVVVKHELAPYFREYLKQELQKWCAKNTKSDGTPYDLYTDGLKIYTTIDSKLQEYAEKAVTKQMVEVQKQFIDHLEGDAPWQDREEVVMDAVRRTARYKKLKEEGMSEAAILQVMSKRVPTKLFTWEGEKEVKMSQLDSIRHHLQFLNAGFLAMEPSSGEVKAWVGGISHDFYKYDHVKASTKRQVGSIFKPIVCAVAIEQGISPCELISAGQETYIDDEGQEWTPRNAQYDYDVQYSMRGALAYSVNTVSVKLIQRAGINNTIRMSRNMGIHSDIPDVPSIALGSSSISLMEMTAAYACLTNEGVSSYPYFITSITDREGNRFDDFKPKISGKRAMSKETAQLVRHMLQTVVNEGTASRLRWKYGVYNDIAGKTGTTQANADGWFMAMTPNLVIGTWVGADDPRIRFKQTNLGQGSNTALPMVAYFLKEVNQNPNYKSISQARFSSLDYSLRSKLNCDLYEFNDTLWQQVERTVHQRDSIIQRDTAATLPPETFLQTLYKRKKRIILASELQAANITADNGDGGR